MEDVYTIKVKTKPDTRNLYPSERRYSASTVSGLAWVHIALAATSFLLACLALVNPNSDIKRLNINDTDHTTVNQSDLFFETADNVSEPVLFENTTESNDTQNVDNNYILVLAPTLITVFALAAGVASIMASVRWYIDRNITWLFIMSVMSTVISLIAFILVASWFVASDGDITDFYKDPDDHLILRHSDIIDKNDTHMLIAKQKPEEDSRLFTKSVLSINILIAAFLEFLWSLLSLKISYKGMRSNYKEDNERQGSCVAVVTTIKGNNASKMPKGKLLSPKPDLIDHYQNRKIKKIFLAQADNGFYLKQENNKTKQNTETSSEFYKERMMNFLNRCASLEGSNSELATSSVRSESVLNTIPEITNVDVNPRPSTPEQDRERVTPLSWGDTPEHTVYNQNNINFDKIFTFAAKTSQNGDDEENAAKSEEKSENCTD